MATAPGFIHNIETGNIDMNAGDTGSFWVCCKRKSGEDWPSTARMLYTISKGSEIMLQRIYRPDDQFGAGDGMMLIEFHNDDTDTWATGIYDVERRYDLTPVWEGTPSTARCVNALQPGAAKMIEGVPVRTVFRGTLEIHNVLGKI